MYVTWNDAAEFCRKLSEQEGVEYHYHLPTEAQWEYTCRAGTTTAYSFGDHPSKLGQYAWYFKNDTSWVGPHRVGQKLPNAWGLYDMHGNVWEWCQDRAAPYGSEKAVSDPVRPAQGIRRVLRGGSFFGQSALVRSANRAFYQPHLANIFLGFRPVRTYP